MALDGTAMPLSVRARNTTTQGLEEPNAYEP
jgi:hypothetical protein